MPRPRISTNLAISADGKISSVTSRPSGWTSGADHARLLELRENADAILVGHGTLKSDRMTMTVPGKASQPLRCIVSRHGDLDPTHPIFTKPGGDIHLLVTGDFTGSVDERVTVHRQPLLGFLNELGTKFGINHLHCEGGGQLIRALAELDAIDEFHLTIAGHTLFGGLEAATATGIPTDFLPKSVDFEITRFEIHEAECFLSHSRVR